MIKTPVLLLVFNRPDLTRKLIESLEDVQPERIFVVADGPRANNDTDELQCQEVRKLFNELSWNCSVDKLFRDENLGCAQSVSDGISWFFEQNEMGIILEDDCIADPSFFSFCSELLEKYKDNQNIFHISGNNFQYGKIRGRADYYFSIFNHLWGWATWKRAWENFEFDINIDDVKDMKTFVGSEKILNYFEKQFAAVIDGKVDSWGFRWTFTCWKNQGLSILPNKNLVTNIGFGADSTHTKQIDSPQSNLPVHSISTPLTHPDKIKINRKADKYSFQKIFQPRNGIRYYLGAAKRRLFS